MIAERLAATGGHDGKDVTLCQDAGDDRLLVGPEFLEPEDLFQRYKHAPISPFSLYTQNGEDQTAGSHAGNPSKSCARICSERETASERGLRR